MKKMEASKSLKFYLTFIIIFSLCKADENVCYQQKLSEFTDVALSKYETLMDTLLLLLEEQKMCKCLKDQIRDLESENEKLRQQLSPKKDCSSWLDAGEKRDAIYTISPDEQTQFPVYCDMSNGGWTVIQRRVDGAINFDRVWMDYARGFGNLSADFWLGLRFMHLLANKPNEISFEFMMKESRENASAVYSNFTIEDEDAFFRMHVSREAVYNNEMSQHITSDNGFYFHNGMQFTTKDADHDLHGSNCATLVGGSGFWYKSCYRLAIINASPISGMALYDTRKVLISKTEVKIRRIN